MRRKPSKLGRTTGTEGVPRLAMWRRRRDILEVSSRDRTHEVDVGGGVIFGKPQERKFDVNRQRGRSSDCTRLMGHEKPHNPDRVFEDEAKERGSRTGRVIVWWRIAHGYPRRSGVQRPRPRGVVGNAKNPATVNNEHLHY